MPRTVNSVAKRSRRKKLLKQHKVYVGRRKNLCTVSKNNVDKAMLNEFRAKTNKKISFIALLSRVLCPVTI